MRRHRKYRYLNGRLILSLVTAAALLWPSPAPALASGEPAPLGNEVVPDDGRPEEVQGSDIPEETTAPLHNAVVPDTGEENEIDMVVPVGNIISKDDESVPAEDSREENVPLSNMVVPEDDGALPEEEDNPFLDILVPGDISFAADPYGILGEGAILSDEYIFENNSGVDVIINLESFEYIPPGRERRKEAPVPTPGGFTLNFVSESLNLVDYEPREEMSQEKTDGKEPEETDEVQSTEAPQPDGGGSPDTGTESTEEPLLDNGLLEEGSIVNTEDLKSEASSEPEEPSEPPALSETAIPGPDGTAEPSEHEMSEPSGSALDMKNGPDEGEETTQEDILICRHSEENAVPLSGSITEKDTAPIFSFILRGGLEEESRAVFRMEGEIDPDRAAEILKGGKVRLRFSCIPYEGDVMDEEAAAILTETEDENKPADKEAGESKTPKPTPSPIPEETPAADKGGEAKTPEPKEPVMTATPEATSEPEESGGEVTPDPGVLEPPPVEPPQEPEGENAAAGPEAKT